MHTIHLHPEEISSFSTSYVLKCNSKIKIKFLQYKYLHEGWTNHNIRILLFFLFAQNFSWNNKILSIIFNTYLQFNFIADARKCVNTRNNNSTIFTYHSIKKMKMKTCNNKHISYDLQQSLLCVCIIVTLKTF